MVQVKFRPTVAAVMASLSGLLQLAMAALVGVAIDNTRSTAAAGYDLIWEAAAGTVLLVACILQGLLAFVVAFGWAGRSGEARKRLVRTSVRAAGGILLVTLIVVALLIALGSNDGAFRGSTVAICVLSVLGITASVGMAAFTALALSDKYRAG